MNNLALSIAIAFSIFLPPAALADAGVPMLIIVWPASWMLLLAIIPIESFIAHRLLDISWKKSFFVVTAANLASTLVGIPATWVLLVALQLLLGGGSAYGLQTDMNKVLAVTLQSPWLIPYEQDLSWMIPAAAAVLCVPFFFMSVVAEYFVVGRFIAKEDRRSVWRWSWIANAMTYSLIIIGLLAVLVNVRLGTFQDKLGYIDLSGKFRAQPKGTSNNGSYSDGLARVEINGKWGYIDKSGSCVIAPQFEDAKPFSDGFAQIREGNKEGYIDEKGQLIIKPQFDKTKPFTQSLACVCVGQKWGFVDKTGALVIKPQYDDVSAFTESRAAVKIGSNWGYIGKGGEVLIKPSYYPAGDFSEGLACVNSSGNDWQYIDNSGRIAFTMPDHCWGKNFSEGLACFFNQRIHRWGFIDKSGKIVIQPIFDKAESFSNGLACVAVGQKRSPEDKSGIYHVDESASRYGYIDRTGTFVIPPTHQFARSFSQGRAAIEVDGKWGFIDPKGNVVVKAEYSQVEPFSDGLAAAGKSWSSGE